VITHPALAEPLKLPPAAGHDNGAGFLPSAFLTNRSASGSQFSAPGWEGWHRHLCWQARGDSALQQGPDVTQVRSEQGTQRVLQELQKGQQNQAGESQNHRI